MAPSNILILVSCIFYKLVLTNLRAKYNGKFTLSIIKSDWTSVLIIGQIALTNYPLSNWLNFYCPIISIHPAE